MRVLLTALLLIPVLVLAPGVNSKPDLSGTWKCIESPKGSGYAGGELVIVQNGLEIKMSHRLTINGQERTIDLVFYADGRIEDNPGALSLPRDDKYENSATSVTVWHGRKLSTKYPLATKHSDFSGAIGFATIDTIDNWELSKDGTRLKQVRTVWFKIIGGDPSARPPNPSGRFLSESKYVYVRQS